MKHCELNKLLGANLQKLRLKSKLTQEQLAERLSISSRVLQKWEAGTKGIGKDVLKNLCKIFNVEPYVFYLDDHAPFITNSREKKILYVVREAEKLGVADSIEEYCDFIVARSKKQKCATRKSTKTKKEDSKYEKS